MLSVGVNQWAIGALGFADGDTVGAALGLDVGRVAARRTYGIHDQTPLVHGMFADEVRVIPHDRVTFGG